MSALTVELFDRLVGDVSIAGTLRSPEDWSFRYRPEYLAATAPVPLSASLPLQDAPFEGARVSNWFCNLLPEGAVRDAVASRLRIPADDEFALLAAIGGECAGAVSVCLSDSTPAIEPESDTPLEDLLDLHGEDAGEGTWAMLGAPLRLSLAGAQDKIAVVLDAHGRLQLPAPGQPSTHILKPDSFRFRGLRDLEAFGLALARAADLHAPQATLVEAGGRPSLLIERFDRTTDAHGTTQRLHQEDFCQALGYPPEMKYQSQGGPSLEAISRLVRSLGIGAAAVQGVLDWVVFNVLVGNADAHAKNLALLCDRDGRRRLAPFYDPVPTLVLPQSVIDRTPALRIGSATRIDDVLAGHWKEFAVQAGYAPRFVLKRVVELADRLLAQARDVGAGLVDQGADARRIERATAILERQMTTTRAAALA